MGGSKKPNCFVRYRDPESGRIITISCNNVNSAIKSTFQANSGSILKEAKRMFGDVIPRTKGDHKIINPFIMKNRKAVAAERKKITREVADLRGQKRTEYLDKKWIDNENKIIDLRQQYDLYGKRTVQGRLLDQHIKGRVHIQQHIERIAGFRPPYDPPNLKGNNYQPQANPKKFVRGFDKYGQPYPGGRRKDSRGFDKTSKNFTQQEHDRGYWGDPPPNF